MTELENPVTGGPEQVWLRIQGRVALRGLGKRGRVGGEGAGLGRLQAGTPQLCWAVEGGEEGERMCAR